MKTTDINTSEFLRGLSRVAPSIAVSVQWQVDHNFRWDGQGDNPRKRGLYAHDVSIRASVVGLAVLRHGFANKGGCYAKPNAFTADDHDVHGYLPGMVEEAITAIDNQFAPFYEADGRRSPEEMRHIDMLAKEIDAAQDYIKRVKLERYAAQQNGKGDR